MAISVAESFRNSRINVIGDAADSGILRLYDGTPPANADTALSGNNVLAELTMNAAAFPAAASGSATAAAITQDSSANATGTATFFRLFQSNGTTLIMQGSVSTSGADLNLVTTSITAGQPVQISSFVLSEAA